MMNLGFCHSLIFRISVIIGTFYSLIVKNRPEFHASESEHLYLFWIHSIEIMSKTKKYRLSKAIVLPVES